MIVISTCKYTILSDIEADLKYIISKEDSFGATTISQINTVADILSYGNYDMYGDIAQLKIIKSIEGQNQESIKSLLYKIGITIYEGVVAGEYDKNSILDSIRLFELALGIDINFYQAHNKLGNCYYLLDKQRLAISQYKTSILVVDHNKSLYENLVEYIHNPVILDNILKIGLCYYAFGNDRMTKLCIDSVSNFANEDYKGYQEFGFNTWNELKNNLGISDSDQKHIFRQINLDGDNLAYLQIGLSRGLFPVPEDGEAYSDCEQENGCIIYFKQNYFDSLIYSMQEAVKNGKFALSNSEEEWNKLMRTIEEATISNRNDIRHLNPYFNK